MIVVTGGAGLNLKVVGGTTQPTNPAENTVWVNTDTEISGWAFSPSEPENPVEGMVWIETSTSSQTPINIDKKNTVMLYPIACKQYISGAWTSKPTETYQNGAWGKWWDGMLFYYGDEYPDITGGFSAFDSVNEFKNSGGALYLKANNQWYGICVTNNAIDLTIYKTVKAETKSSYGGEIIVASGKSKDKVVASTSAVRDAYGEVSIDVSNLEGSYYIGMKQYGTSGVYLRSLKVE